MELSPEQSKLSYDAIDEYAERVGREYSIYNADGTADLDKLIKKLGGNIGTMDSSRTSLLINGKGTFTIYLPASISSRKKRFSVARSLGQYFLHYRYPGLKGTMRFIINGNTMVNTQGNVFGSSLLMPAKEFAERYVEYGGDNWVLSGLFGVSPLAIDTRLKRLPLDGSLLRDFPERYRNG